MVWAPDNAKAAAAGRPDTLDAARLYLHATVSGEHNAAVRDAFLQNAARAIDWLEAHDILRLQPVALYPDYYPDRPGATLGGRVLEPVPFDARRLGADFARLRPPLPEFTAFGGMMIAAPRPRAFPQHWPLRAIHLARSRAGEPACMPAAVPSRAAPRWCWAMRWRRTCCTRCCACMWNCAWAVPWSSWCWSNRRVCGVVAGGRLLRASRGVVLATGGFSHHQHWRSELLPSGAGPLSAACADNTADGFDLATQAGAVVERRGEGGAFWAPVSRFTRSDGSDGLFPHTVTDRGKPGAIAVNGQARRFVNEALSYHEFVRAMLRDANAPAYLIADSRFVWLYGLGAVRPFALSLRRWKRIGYLTEAADIRHLAQALHLDPDQLDATVQRFNRFARVGTDPDFHRGEDAYQRYLGDPQHVPNPCLRQLERPPFYAITLYPADLGTSSGLATDASARVLDAEGGPIPGLYACGNDMNSVMNGAYPGPGITLGPALTFGFLAAESLAAAGARHRLPLTSTSYPV